MAAYWATSFGRVILIAAVGVSSATALSSNIQNPMVAIARRWMIPILLVWGVALTITGGLAPVVWGEQGALVGIVGGLSTAGVVALAIWACRSHNREVAERRAREEAG